MVHVTQTGRWRLAYDHEQYYKPALYEETIVSIMTILIATVA